MTKEDVKLLERTEMRMLRWMAGVSRSERRTNQTIRTAFGIQSISLVVRQHRLRWFGHIETKYGKPDPNLPCNRGGRN